MTRIKRLTFEEARKLYAHDPKAGRWNPVLRGNIFCAPGCGLGCTKAMFMRALRAAEDCLARMKTEGWNIRLHENLGWYWHLENANGLITVNGEQYDFRSKHKLEFHCMFSTDCPGSCDARFYDDKLFSDPNEAVEHRLKLVSLYAARIGRIAKAAKLKLK